MEKRLKMRYKNNKMCREGKRKRMNHKNNELNHEGIQQNTKAGVAYNKFKQTTAAGIDEGKCLRLGHNRNWSNR